MSLGRYTILVLGVVLVTLGLAWPLALRRLDRAAWFAVLFGAAVAVLNTAAAHALFLWSLRRTTPVFFQAVLGGMGLRMALMLAAVVVGIVALELPRLPLVVPLLSYFILFLTLELAIVHRQTGAPSEAAR